MIVPEVLRLQMDKLRTGCSTVKITTHLFQFLFRSRLLLRFNTEANPFRSFAPFGFLNQGLSFPDLRFLSEFQQATFQRLSALGTGQVQLVWVRHTRQEPGVNQFMQKCIILPVRSEIVSALQK